MENVRAVIEAHKFLEAAMENMPVEDVSKVLALAQHIRVQVFDANDLINMLEYPHNFNEQQVNRVWNLLHVSSQEADSYLAKVQKSGGLNINVAMDDFERFCFFYTLAHKIWQAVIGLSVVNTLEYKKLLATLFFILNSTPAIAGLREAINNLIFIAEDMARLSGQDNILGDPFAYSWLEECGYAPRWTHSNSNSKFVAIERQRDEEADSIINE